VFNINSSILYDFKRTVKLIFNILENGIIEDVLQAVYTFSTFINLISTGQLKKDGIEYNRHKDCFVVKIGQDVATIIWIINVFVLSIQNIPTDEYLIQINLDFVALKIIYKVLYNQLIYIYPEHIFKATKDVGIPLSRKEALEYYYYHCHISKSI